MSLQSWEAPFSPMQRWILLQLALAPNAANITTSAEGKAFRRALRAFGLTAIRDALGDAGNKVSDKLAHCRTPALFRITAENVEQALKWAAVPRHPSMELDAGEAFDVLEQLRDNPNGWKAPDFVPAYSPDAEDWRPESTPDELEALDLLTLMLDNPNPVNGWSSVEWERAQQLVDRHRKT